MLASTHRFFLRVSEEGGQAVCRSGASGFLSVYEDLLFAAVSAGLAPNDGQAPEGTVEPVWREGRVDGVVAELAGLRKTYPLEIFRHDVHELLLRKGLLGGGGDAPAYEWLVEAAEALPARTRTRVRVRREPYPFEERDLSSMGIAALGGEPSGGLRLYVMAQVFEELRRETASSLAVERADILTGVLLRAGAGAAAVVTGRFPLAFDTTASAVHVAFSPLTFEAARQERTRVRGDSLLGWHHNHPPKCGRDCLMTVPACENDSIFLSIADYSVFLGGFPSSHLVGLISGKGKNRRADDPDMRAYGWRDGIVREIPFTVVGD